MPAGGDPADLDLHALHGGVHEAGGAALLGDDRKRVGIPFKELVATRHLGTIAALDLVVPDAGYLSALAPRLTAFYRDRGVLLRPLGNSVYVMPPYCTGADELAEIWAAIAASLDIA